MKSIGSMPYFDIKMGLLIKGIEKTDNGEWACLVFQ